MKYFLIALSFAMTPTATFAQEVGGEARITFEEREHVASLDPSQSDWTNGSVSLNFRTVDSQTREFFLGLILGFTYYAPPGTGVDHSDLEVARLSGGKIERLASENEEEKGELVLEILRYDVDGDYLTVTGTFHSQMGPTQDYGRTIDLSEPIEVRGEFSVVVGSLE
jgi:hypothetical protein